jgi:hypothetical protein
MLPFRMFVNLQPRSVPPAAPRAFKRATGQPVCKLVTLKTPTDTCIPFLFNTFASHRSRRASTGSLLSSFLSSPCGLFPLQQGGTPPSPSSASAHLLLLLPEITHIREISTRPERLMPFTIPESLITGHDLPADTGVPRRVSRARLYFSRCAVRDSHPALRSRLHETCRNRAEARMPPRRRARN